MIEVSEQTMNRMHALLSGVGGSGEKVLKPAFTRGLMAGKTAAKKEVRNTYNIKAGDFAKKAFIRIDRPSKNGDTIIGSIEFAGTVIPLMRFKVEPRTPKHGAAPSAAVLKANSLVPLDIKKNAFVAQMGSGHIGVFERVEGEWSDKRRGGKNKNKHTEKIKELYSPSAPAMVGNKKVMQSVEERVNEVISQRIEHEIERILQQYG